MDAGQQRAQAVPDRVAGRGRLVTPGFVENHCHVLWIGGMTLLQRREQAGRVRELERFQAKLLDNLPDGLLTLDESGVVRGANPSALALLGGDDLLGRRWDELPLNQSLNPAFGQRSMKNGSDEYGGQYAYADRHLEILAVPLNRDGRDAGERLVLIRDRTAIKKLEESLQEAERLAAIGRLAASVAHEIRNPLSALRGFAQYFAQKLVGREPEQSYADTMVSEADRLNGVITDLLFLAKPRQPCKKRVNLLALIEDVRTLIKTDLERHGVEMKAVPAAEPFADVDLLKQCLLNLAMNALQAAPSRDGWLVVGSETGENGTVVYVADNGTGMNAQQRRRALEPFFTTRKDGSGLGLAIVHRIVRDHGGSLDIVSEPDGGTRVSLFFPDSP